MWAAPDPNPNLADVRCLRPRQAYIWEDKVFRSDFVGGRLTRNIISAAELDAKIAGAVRRAFCPGRGLPRLPWL